MYLIQRNEPSDNGKPTYVSQPGSKHSYTTDPIRARRFSSREAAEGHCCGNERPVKRSDVLEY